MVAAMYVERYAARKRPLAKDSGRPKVAVLEDKRIAAHASAPAGAPSAV